MFIEFIYKGDRPIGKWKRKGRGDKLVDRGLFPKVGRCRDLVEVRSKSGPKRSNMVTNPSRSNKGDIVSLLCLGAFCEPSVIIAVESNTEEDRDEEPHASGE